MNLPRAIGNPPRVACLVNPRRASKACGSLPKPKRLALGPGNEIRSMNFMRAHSWPKGALRLVPEQDRPEGGRSRKAVAYLRFANHLPLLHLSNFASDWQLCNEQTKRPHSQLKGPTRIVHGPAKPFAASTAQNPCECSFSG